MTSFSVTIPSVTPNSLTTNAKVVFFLTECAQLIDQGECAGYKERHCGEVQLTFQGGLRMS